ncbi:hypothetical protein [Hoeflea sp.]|uniref:hypothetical protein n=1 Tax=Hoeflea sp. TaxID=1940281 RepID=UPI003BAF4D91
MKARSFLAIASFLILCGLSAPASAANLDGLVGKGFDVSKLTTNRAGKLGWKLSKGGETYFCRMKNFGVIRNGNGLISFTSGGRTVKIDKQTYLNSLGRKEMPKGTPDYVDLKSGRVDGKVAGRCSKM